MRGFFKIVGALTLAAVSVSALHELAHCFSDDDFASATTELPGTAHAAVPSSVDTQDDCQTSVTTAQPRQNDARVLPVRLKVGSPALAMVPLSPFPRPLSVSQSAPPSPLELHSSFQAANCTFLI